MKEKNSLIRKLILILILTFACAALVTARPTPKADLDKGNGGAVSLSPQPGTVDQIIHNIGNIVTTVDNWGYIGGYQYYGLPSGEWPRNSGHDYIGEIKYWMGATNGVDTIVANSYDDFQALPSIINGSPEYKILLSTDPDRYYAYDESDTVGLGVGRPAHGWRVYDAAQDAWVYNQSYYPLSASFLQSGPTSLQESYYIMRDNADGQSLGLEVSQTIMQWNYCYNENLMFVVMDITNTSANNYTDFAFGLYIDLDVGGPDGTGENGRLGDLVGFDAAENLAWTYDEDALDPGWGPDVTTGVMGTKYLETPDDIGMTAFRTGDWAAVTSVDDPGRYDMIASNQFDASLPPTDQYYLQCTRGIDLSAGKTVRVVYALIAGEDETAFRANADLAQQLYDAYFVGPEPPATPKLTARAGDGKVYLSWTDTSEVSLDPLTQTNDFGGYKLYRSDNRGYTWGKALGVHDEISDCMSTDYKTKATYKVNAPGDPIPHSYIDSNLTNGVDYWYCLAAFDRGDTTIGIDVLQSGFGIAGEATNVVSVMPRRDPAGYYHSDATVQHLYGGTNLPSEGEIFPSVFDPSRVTGSEYKVVFEDRPEDTYWHVLNNVTGDTVLADQTITEGDPGLFPVFEGLRVTMTNPEREPVLMAQTGFASADTTLGIDMSWWLGSAAEYFYGDFFSDAPIRASYELRYTNTTTVSQAFNDTLGMTYNVPFELWDTRKDQQVALFVYDFGLDGAFDPWDLVMFSDYPYNPAEDMISNAWPYDFSWFFGFDANYNPQPGDVLTIEGPLLHSPDDAFTFKVDGIDVADAKADMGKIRVVPNPYFGISSTKWETSAGASRLQFQSVPASCTIRIYTLSGNLVRTIKHSSTDSGAAEWDLLSEDGRQVASGVYFYHVESDYGTKSGRFAVIK